MCQLPKDTAVLVKQACVWTYLHWVTDKASLLSFVGNINHHWFLCLLMHYFIWLYWILLWAWTHISSYDNVAYFCWWEMQNSSDFAWMWLIFLVIVIFTNYANSKGRECVFNALIVSVVSSPALWKMSVWRMTKNALLKVMGNTPCSDSPEW